MKRLFAFALAGALTLLCACAPQPSVPQTPAQPPVQQGEPEHTGSPYDLKKVNEINLALGHSGTQGSLNGYWAQRFKRRVEELSCGKITVDIYGDSKLGSDLEIARACQYGTVDIHITSPAALASMIPEVAVFDMPFLFNDLEQAREALAEETFFEYLAGRYKENGLILLPFTDQGFRNLSLSVPVEGLEDFKGLTVRCMDNPHHTAFWQALGFDTVSMDIAGVYLALQKGGVHGQENPYHQIYTRKFYEVQKYVTNSRHLLYIGDMHVSKITWDSLSAVSQEILWQAALDAQAAMPEYVDEANLTALEQMTKEGIRLIDFDNIPDLRQRCRSLTYDVAYESISAVTGTEILDLWCAAAQRP